jgi:hypothetical protein
MMSTYLCEAFAMGVASKDLTSQANRFVEGESSVFITHTKCGDAVSVLVSKYILDEKWLGDFRTTPSRSNTQLQPDEGRFYGVQDGTRMIGVYAPRVIGARQPCSGLKLALIWQRRDLVDEIWVDDRKIESLPTDVAEGSTVVVGSGQAWVAIRPLARTHLSHRPPLRLVERQGSLVLEIYNYEGVAKTFWELGWPGSFYQGQPQCGFYAEVAERSALGRRCSLCSGCRKRCHRGSPAGSLHLRGRRSDLPVVGLLCAGRVRGRSRGGSDAVAVAAALEPRW